MQINQEVTVISLYNKSKLGHLIYLDGKHCSTESLKMAAMVDKNKTAVITDIKQLNAVSERIDVTIKTAQLSLL